MSSSGDAQKPARPARFLRLNAIFALPVLIVPALLAYYFMIDGAVREQVLAQSVDLAGYKGQAEVEEVTFSIFGPKLTVRELRAWQDLEGGRHEVLYVGEANFDVEFWALLERRLVVNEVTASRIRYESPRPEPAPPGGPAGGPSPQPEAPPKTPNDYVNDYLKQVEDFLNSDEYRQGKEWLEKLRKYMDEREDKEAKEAARRQRELTGQAGRPTYVTRALREQGVPPALVVKKAGVSELEFVLGTSGNAQLGSKLSNVELVAQSVSSDPLAYRLPMEFKAGGNLDGDAGRRVELGLVLRFDPEELVRLEQVKGGFTLARLPLEGLVDTSEFGDTLLGVELSLVHYAPTHPALGGRTRLTLAGGINPPGFSIPGKSSRLNVNLWFGGYAKENKLGPFLPSGLGFSVEHVALDGLLGKAGGLGLPVARGASFSFGTCDEQGRFDTPQAAVTWHDGLDLKLRLSVDGLKFNEAESKGKQVLGLPADLLAKGLNRVMEGMSADGKRLEVMVGFSGKASDFKFGIMRPGLRTFVDACINALYLNADEIESLVELPFAVGRQGRIGLFSADALGNRRTPAFDLERAQDEGLGDLRVVLSLSGLTIAPRAGQSRIAGLPADDFCTAFNTFVANQGEAGVKFRCRLFNGEGKFSPALESPGLRGLVDALVGVFGYSGRQLNEKFNLPFVLPDDLQAQLLSVDGAGSPRNFSSPGADSDSLADLRVALNVSKARISPKPGQDRIFGLPAREFCAGFNQYAEGLKGKPLSFRLRAFDGGGSFSPALESPGVRGLVDSIIGAVTFSGKQLNESFDLPFTVHELASVRSVSVTEDGKPRDLSSPGADLDSLGNLRLVVYVANAYAVKKAGQDKILGIPADYFIFAWNSLVSSFPQGGMPLTFHLFDAGGKFAPSLAGPTPQGLLTMMGSAIGIAAFEKNFGQIDTKYKNAFEAFKMGDLSKAGDLAKAVKGGKDISPADIPKEIPKELPKEPPKIPKLPWG